MHPDSDNGEDGAGLVVSDERQIMNVGNSLGITLPPPILNALNLEKGDTVEVSREDGNAVFEVRAVGDATGEGREQELEEIEAD